MHAPFGGQALRQAQHGRLTRIIRHLGLGEVRRMTRDASREDDGAARGRGERHELLRKSLRAEEGAREVDVVRAAEVLDAHL